MKLDIHIIKDSEVTIREQLFEQIVFLIATGRLKPGEVLPSVRVRARYLLPYRLVSPTCLKQLSTAMEA